MVYIERTEIFLIMSKNISTTKNSESNKTGIGKRIRKLRLQHGLSQEEFAESIDVSTNFVSELETGKKGMSVDTLCRISKEYHISADMILFGDASSRPLLEHVEQSLSAIPTEDIPTIISYLQSLYKIRQLNNSNPR